MAAVSVYQNEGAEGMKKILFLIHDLGQGGAEKVLVNLVNNLDRSKFDISVISLFGGGVNEQFLKPDVHFRTAFKRSFPGNSRLMKLLTPKQLHRWLIKDHYDIEGSYLEGPSARIISGCADPDTKLISWIHVEQHTRETADKAFRNHAEALQCYRRFDHTVCVSEFVKQDFLSLYPGIKNVSVLYNTNETDEILEKQHEPVEEGLFQGDEIRLCGVGKLMPIKGFDKLARIHKRLHDEGFPVHTYLLGSGPEKERIQQYVEENGLQKSFTFLGYQTNPYKYVAKCDLFVCTSSAEGFSTAATEALILGVPVVTTPVSGMKEMLGEHNEYGIVTEGTEESLHQAIKELLEDSDKLKHYKEQATRRGKDFSKEKTVKMVEELLETL
jgi:glycosyltransferase involved in cell wall biosynthesis